jgi:D-alanine-D-alanine ligase
VRPLLGIVFGGPSPEHDISILTGLLCERVLREAGQDVVPLYWTRTGEWVQCPARSEAKDFLEGAPKGSVRLDVLLGSGFQTQKKGLGGGKALGLDAALNCCHGGSGENGGLNGVFDLLGIPLTGGPAPMAALGMDKLAFGAVLQAHGIPTLARFAVGSEVPFEGPYIVKPRFGGSSIGIEVVEDLATAQALAKTSVHLRQGAIVEPFSAKAVDLNMGYRTHPAVEVSLLEKPLAPAAAEGIYSYGQKYLQTDGLAAAPRELPAKVPAAVLKEAERLTRAVLTATGIRGVGRLDFLLIGKKLHVNEINTIPGSMGMYLWPASNDAAKMLLGAVQEAKQSFGLATPAPFEPGAALRASGGMAGKLGQIGSAG